MIDLRDPNYVKSLKANCHAVFDTPQGKEVMKFLEVSCRWYQSVFNPDSPDMTLINDGKRQVVATLKTILECSPEQLVQLATRNQNQ